MLKETLLNKQSKPIILLDEFEKAKDNKLVQIQGTLTSNIHSRKSSDTPYYCFFRSNTNDKHSLTECIRSKCQDCDIPVIFRIKEACQFHAHCSETCRYKQNWQNPNLTKGQEVLLRGNWAKSDHSSRPSFTVYSYQFLND